MPNGYRRNPDVREFGRIPLPVVYERGPIDRLFYGATEDPRGADYGTWKRLMRDWYGLTPLRGDAWVTRALCAHNLVGKKCPAVSCPIVAQFMDRPGLWDHARAWRTHGGELVFTLEPWGNPFDSVDIHAAMERELDAIGVSMAFEGRSPYGSSYVLFLTEANTELGARMLSARSRARRRRPAAAEQSAD
ncbi:hypothetical protein I3U40_18220 [Mycobacteroides abscessus subsp. abscessus]|uniref:hypothetical protein n=1 Tax=Mycobacteroides abscessus TaxID=36809 RepID=UPI0009CF8C7F|nr:hypothetical protein [Mycobacteroides abscessus]QSM92993.1 hypothetical protein I3U31_18210 [Mycobacteroides abscessus subsp. abscessus]QSM98031.1 hypothetical protein I3U40_18220 [Mycobacteroides abscessus subsp. abscessus]SLI40911.1 Uncharacterised protein [Mycobacteroides abscessus subsp. abscessus]